MPKNQSRAAPTPVSQQPERRGQIRQVALLRVALLHAAGASDICVVKNLSPNGLSARVYRKLAAGEEVEVEFRSGELVAGSVVWADECEVGVVFPKGIDVNAVLASGSVVEASKRRALPRISVQCPGQLSTGMRSMDIVLQDISQGGASLVVKRPMTSLGSVRLLLANLPPITGVVRWTSGEKVGISFNEKVPFEQLAQWIQAHREGLGLRAREHGPARTWGGRNS